MPNLFRREPVLVTSLVTAVVGFISTFLVTHGVITSTVASTTVQEVLPTAVLIALSAVGVFIREFVTPVAMTLEVRANTIVDRYAPDLSAGARRAESWVNTQIAGMQTMPASNVVTAPTNATMTWPTTVNTATVVPAPVPTSAWSRGAAVPPVATLSRPIVPGPMPQVPPADPNASESGVETPPMSAGSS